MKKKMIRSLYNLRRDFCFWLLGFHECPEFMRKNWNQWLVNLISTLAVSIACAAFFLMLLICYV